MARFPARAAKLLPAAVYVAEKLRPFVAEKERLLAAAGRLSARTPGRHMLLPRSCVRHPLHPAPLSRSCSRRGSCSGYAVLRGEKAPDDALARELGAMGLLCVSARAGSAQRPRRCG